MAITFNTDRLQGLAGVVVNGVYARIQAVTVKKHDASGSYTLDANGNETNTLDVDSSDYQAAGWNCLYDVILHASADVRNAKGESPQWRNQLISREIGHFVCPYDPASADNPYTQAYADLKARLVAGDTPVATNIVDA